VRLALGPVALDVQPGAPVLMGIVNATPDSFSDPQGRKDPGLLAELALELVQDGAGIVDVGGESGRTDREAVPEAEEAARIVPLRGSRCRWTPGGRVRRALPWRPARP
jgi:dihydropteroate synthase